MNPCNTCTDSNCARHINPCTDRLWYAHTSMLELEKQHNEALTKHPPEEWGKMDRADMIIALTKEVGELGAALHSRNLKGEHGVEREALHVQVVARRIVEETKRREQLYEQ